MRILVISDLPQFVTGGAEIQAGRLIEAWLRVGHEVMCFGRRMGAGSVDIGGYRIPVRRIVVAQGFGRAGRALSYFLSLSALLLRHRSWPDVIYTRFLNEGAATVAILKRLKLLRTVLVPTPANAGVNGDDKVIAALPFARQLVQLLDAQCEAINLIAPAMAPSLRAIGFSGRNFEFIPNGIELPSLARKDRGDGALQLMFSGRLTAQKGLDLLLEALAQQPTEQRNFLLTIVGDGPERPRLTTITSRLGLDGNVRFVGEKPQAEVQTLLAGADAFVLPSRYEGMSNAGLEAMAAGLPVLLTRCGGLDTHVDDSCAWLVPPEDVVALADAMRRIVATPRPTLIQMGARARAIVEGNFTMPQVARRYLDLFDRLRYAASIAALPDDGKNKGTQG